jgi:hypothetical protein
MRPSLLAFVQAFIQSAASARLESAMQFYAPTVDYYDKGAVDADFIRKDLAELRRRWPRRDFQLLDSPVARLGPGENQFLVTYRVNFVMGDRRNDPRGISDVTVLIQDNDGTYSVLAVHEIIEKNDSPGR